MATDHQRGGVSVFDLTDDSLNESILINKKDKQISPYTGNKNYSNKNIGAHSSDLSIGKDCSTITSEQSNKIVPIAQDNIGNSSVMERMSLRLDGESLSEAAIQCFKINQIFNSFNEFKELFDTFSIEWGFRVTRYCLYMRYN